MSFSRFTRVFLWGFAMTAISTAASGPALARGTDKTIVLVHGGFVDGDVAFPLAAIPTGQTGMSKSLVASRVDAISATVRSQLRATSGSA
jgi:hypothetical protein